MVQLDRISLALAFLVGLALGGFTLAWADAETGGSPKARFERQLQEIDRVMQEARDSSDPVDFLVRSEVRTHVFRLQSLARLYENRYGSDFKALRKDSKALEDAIGGFEYSQDMLDYATSKGASPAKIRELERKLEESRTKFEELLSGERWLKREKSKVSRIQKLLEKTDWDSPAKDRKFALDMLTEDLRALESTSFDMNILEEGIHELRRRLRWFLLTAIALDGLVLQKESCSSPFYSKLLTDKIAKSKYSILDGSGASSPCMVSRCLYLGIVKAVKDLGDLKDEGQGEDAVGGEHAINPAIFRGAERIYSELKQEGLLTQLADEIQACPRK